MPEENRARVLDEAEKRVRVADRQFQVFGRDAVGQFHRAAQVLDEEHGAVFFDRLARGPFARQPLKLGF